MAETYYLFAFLDETIYEMNCAVSFKDAIWEMAKYTGNSSEMFHKCLNGYESNDINGLVDLFNHFCVYSTIEKVFVIEQKIYDHCKEIKNE